MATVIDELILQLKLDPSSWEPGQRRALQNLRDLENNAKRSGRQVEQVGISVGSFFRALESPISGLRQHFERLASYSQVTSKKVSEVFTVERRNYEQHVAFQKQIEESTKKSSVNLTNLGSQARRTGASVEAGGVAGASGIRALGIAGLAALVTVTALGKAMEFAAKTSQKVFGQGVGAAAAGVGIGQFTSVSQALFKSGNVPQEETQGWLARYQSARQRADVGDYSEAVALNTAIQQALGGTGASVDVFSERDPTKALERIARGFSTLNPETAAARGGMLGLSPTAALGLRGAGGNLPQLVQAEQALATTKAQEDAAKRLLEAQNKLSVSWDRLTRDMNQLIDGPLATFEQWLSRVLDTVTGKAANDAVADTAASLIPGAGPAVNAATRVWRWLKGDIAGTGGPPAPGARGPAGAAPASGTDVDLITDTVRKAGGNTQAQAAFLAMFNTNEDPGLSPSMVERGPGKGPGAGGLGGASWAQWTGSRRRQLEGFGWTGTNPEEDRKASAKMLYWELTINPQFHDMLGQMNGAPSADAAAKIGGFIFEQGSSTNVGAFGQGHETQETLDRSHSAQAQAFYNKLTNGSSRPLFPPGSVKYNSRGEPYSASLEKLTAQDKANIAASMTAGFPRQVPGWLQSANVATADTGAAGPQTSTTVNVGSVNVHAATNDPYQHGGAVASVLNKMATQANAGLN